MKLYGWLKVIITVLAMVAIPTITLFTGTSCKSGIQLPNLGGLPKEAGTYINVGNGWEKLTSGQLDWQPSLEYPRYGDIRISNNDLEKVALVIKKGSKKIKMGWRMTPSEQATISQAIFLDQTLLRSQIMSLEKKQGKVFIKEQVQRKGMFGDMYTDTVSKESGSIDGWDIDYQAGSAKPTELPDSKPTEGIQLIEFTIPTSSTAFLMNSIMGNVYLRF